MSNLNHKGPQDLGTKTGRMLGNCKKSEEELTKQGELGVGMGKHFNSQEGKGKGKRLKYNLNKYKQSN